MHRQNFNFIDIDYILFITKTFIYKTSISIGLLLSVNNIFWMLWVLCTKGRTEKGKTANILLNYTVQQLFHESTLRILSKSSKTQIQNQN